MGTRATAIQMLSSDAVLQRFDTLNGNWCSSPLTRYHSDVGVSLDLLLNGLHSCNSFSWQVDDLSRAKCSDSILMDHKRNLDASNLMRSSFMEAIDGTIVEIFDLRPRDTFEELHINSETIGQIIDRLSVLSLKQHNVIDQLSEEAAAKVEARLSSQIDYVSHCLDRFLKSLNAGNGHMLAYKQFKTYRGA